MATQDSTHRACLSSSTECYVLLKMSNATRAYVAGDQGGDSAVDSRLCAYDPGHQCLHPALVTACDWALKGYVLSVRSSIYSCLSVCLLLTLLLLLLLPPPPPGADNGSISSSFEHVLLLLICMQQP